MEDFACSVACLQAAARPALPSGVVAALRQASRNVFMEELNWARAISGTLPLTHASYLAMYSSHSGTPTLSPAAGAVLVVVVVVLLELLVVELLLFVVSVLVQPINTNAHNTQKAKKVLVSIGELLVGYWRNLPTAQ